MRIFFFVASAAALLAQDDAAKETQGLLKTAQQQRAAGRYAEAESLLLQGWHAVEERHGGASEQVAQLLGDLARTERALGKRKEAQLYMDRAVSIRRAGAGLKTLLAKDLASLGLMLAEDRQRDLAVKVYREAAAILETEIAPDAPELLPVLDMLGALLRDHHEYEEAAPVYERLLAIREAAFGREDGELLATLDSLAYVYFGQRRFDAAEPVYERLLRLWQDIAGPEHPMAALTLEKMAEFYLAQGREEEAACAARRAASLRRIAYANGVLLVAKAAAENGWHDEAETAYKQASELSVTIDQQARSAYFYSRYLRGLGRTREADALRGRYASEVPPVP